jgi:polyisoprenoid-binding protein YceI
MKIPSLLLILCSLLAIQPLCAQQLSPADEGSAIEFSIKNFGFTAKGSFSGLSGKILYAPADPLHASFDVHILAKSINTGNNSRDRHLREDDYFDVEHFPQISIKSESITAAKQNGAYILHGILTIKGTSRKIDLPFTVKPEGSGFIFEGSITINRLDYKVGSSSISLADNATVYLKVFAK